MDVVAYIEILTSRLNDLKTIWYLRVSTIEWIISSSIPLISIIQDFGFLISRRIRARYKWFPLIDTQNTGSVMWMNWCWLCFNTILDISIEPWTKLLNLDVRQSNSRMTCLCCRIRKAKKNSKWERIASSSIKFKVQSTDSSQSAIFNFAYLK